MQPGSSRSSIGFSGSIPSHLAEFLAAHGAQSTPFDSARVARMSYGTAVANHDISARSARGWDARRPSGVRVLSGHAR